MIPNPYQFSALQNGLKPNLASQLFAGNTAGKSRGAIAASHNVKSPSVYNPSVAQGISLGVTTPTIPAQTHLGVTGSSTQGTPQFSMSTGAPPPPLGSLGTTPVVKHTIAADGTQSVTHAPPTPPTTAGTDQPAQSAPSPAPTNVAPQPPTFPGLVGSLAQNSQSGSPVAGSAAGGLMSAPAQNNAIGQQAVDIAKQFGQKLADVGKQGAAFEAGQLTTGTSPVAEGNAAITAQTTAKQQQALAEGEQAALTGTGQELTAQNQGQAGLTSAGNLGNTAQGLLQSGLTSAATLGQPQAYGLTSQPYNPLSDTYGGGGAGGVLDRAALAGKVQGATAAAAAPGQAQASNITTSGTAGTNAANTGYQQAVQDYGGMTATSKAADAQIGQVQNVLSSTGLNQGVPDYNKAINTLQNKLGGTAYTQLVTSMTELQNIYSQLLSASGTTPSGSESQALALLNPNSSASQINAAIGQLQTAAYNRLNAQYGKMQTFQSNLGSGSAPSGSSSSSLYSF